MLTGVKAGIRLRVKVIDKVDIQNQGQSQGAK
jgi:hypothetical protein